MSRKRTGECTGNRHPNFHRRSLEHLFHTARISTFIAGYVLLTVLQTKPTHPLACPLTQGDQNSYGFHFTEKNGRIGLCTCTKPINISKTENLSLQATMWAGRLAWLGHLLDVQKVAGPNPVRPTPIYLEKNPA